MLLSKEETIEIKGIGVIIGRFQVKDLTQGHRDIIETVIGRHEKVICVLGAAPVSGGSENPLDIESRRQMISESYPDIQLLYNDDQPTNKGWSKKLDSLIKYNTPPLAEVTLYGSRESFKPYYLGLFPVVELIQESYTSGTSERRNASYKVINSSDWRAGAIWNANNRFPTAFGAVDVAIIDRKHNRLLLGRKPHQSKFRFVGGFLDPDTNALEGDFLEINARREVKEETTLEVGNLKYLASFLINDWRYRNERDKIYSTLFVADYTFGRPDARDDIDELRWFDIDTIKESDVVEEHKYLIKTLLNSLKS
jgi:bifunctional NMN adenylyltransferase/nudix hydrolase